MKLHQNVLRVILVGQRACLNRSAEAAGHVRVAGVRGVAVDICLDAALADHHIPVTARRACPDSKIGLSLAKDLENSRIGLPVRRKSAKANRISALDILCNSIM